MRQESRDHDGLMATRHSVEVRFAAPGPFVRADALGEELSYCRGDYRVTISMPSGPCDFNLEDEHEIPFVPALSPEQPAMAGTGPVYAVNTVQVAVDFDGRGSMSDKAGLGFDTIRPALDQSWQKGHELACAEFQAFLGWFRVHTKQSWLGIAGEPPQQFGRSYLREVGRDGFLIAYGPTQTVTMRNGHVGASKEQLTSTLHDLKEAADVSPQFSLLADARFLAREADLIDGHRAVLSAAMACEIAAKKVLRAKTTEALRPAVDLLLRRRSNLPELVTELAEVAVNRSLRLEDAELLRQVRELSRLRNAIVHSGVSVPQSDASRLVHAAEQLMSWLDSL